MVARPRVLIADEPGAHLDPAARRLVLDRVRDEVARGLAVVWVTQEPVEWAAADRLLDLEPVGADRASTGRRKEAGETDERAAPSEPQSNADQAPRNFPPLVRIEIVPRTASTVGPSVAVCEPWVVELPERAARWR